jgi:2-C-methyl-D-erythritol 2,4-cyclodiphosphate synthase
VREGGHEIGNVDVTVILEAPKIRDYVSAMRDAIAGALGIDADRVSVKGKTNEGVDAVGRGEAIAAHASGARCSVLRPARCSGAVSEHCQTA